MILLDISNILVSNLMQNIKLMSDNSIPQEDMYRHMILNTIRSNYMKFKKEYGELVICCDNKNGWRKAIFPEYKANRKKTRDSSSIDWAVVYKMFNQILFEIDQVFDWKMVTYESAEADDIIYTLCVNSEEGSKHLIISGDQDLLQIQHQAPMFVSITQYAPVAKKFYTTTNQYDLFEHVCRGDTSDGVPNILSDQRSFVEGIRQKTLTTKLIHSWWNYFTTHNTLDPSMPIERYILNNKLINLNMIPEEIQQGILDTYKNITKPKTNQMQIMKYFMENRLMNLSENIGDFT
jgi:5'-3' exonuclease